MIGAITANIYFVLIISVFSMRLVGRPEVGRWIGLTSFLVVVPLIYLFVDAFQTNRSHIYFLWLGLMILFLFAELLIDYVLKLEFRSVRWATILYVIFFFGATGGMIGVAGQAGKWWTAATVLTFLVMAAMAFVQLSPPNNRADCYCSQLTYDRHIDNITGEDYTKAPTYETGLRRILP